MPWRGQKGWHHRGSGAAGRCNEAMGSRVDAVLLCFCRREWHFYGFGGEDCRPIVRNSSVLHKSVWCQILLRKKFSSVSFAFGYAVACCPVRISEVQSCRSRQFATTEAKTEAQAELSPYDGALGEPVAPYYHLSSSFFWWRRGRGNM
jgi:hypothetical protein